ncbi:MAG: RidA family protein [Cytophagales bacterium]|nr:RidA family protein [Cytophagales bacterium]
METLSPEAKLKKLQLKLPPAPEPKGVYRPLLKDDKYVYVSGHGPVTMENDLIRGRVGSEVDKDYGKAAARQTGLAILSTLRANLGSLNKIKRVIKVLGMVNCTPDFEEHPYVINGVSELFAEVFGETHGIGVRSAVGMGSLSENISVEIEAIFELH